MSQDFRERLMDVAAGVCTEARIWWPLYIAPDTMECFAGVRGYDSERTAWSVANRNAAKLNTYVAVRFDTKIVIYTGQHNVLCKRTLAA